MRVLIVSLFLAASAAAPAFAQEAAQPPAEPAKVKKVCKTDTGTGSIMPKRICRTKEEWALIEAQGKADLDRTRDMERSRSMVSGNR